MVAQDPWSEAVAFFFEQKSALGGQLADPAVVVAWDGEDLAGGMSVPPLLDGGDRFRRVRGMEEVAEDDQPTRGVAAHEGI